MRVIERVWCPMDASSRRRKGKTSRTKLIYYDVVLVLVGSWDPGSRLVLPREYETVISKQSNRHLQIRHHTGTTTRRRLDLLSHMKHTRCCYFRTHAILPQHPSGALLDFRACYLSSDMVFYYHCGKLRITDTLRSMRVTYEIIDWVEFRITSLMMRSHSFLTMLLSLYGNSARASYYGEGAAV